jgi:site-specific recombinase
MHNVREPAAIEQLVDEIVCLVRSQIASIAGNLAWWRRRCCCCIF